MGSIVRLNSPQSGGTNKDSPFSLPRGGGKEEKKQAINDGIHHLGNLPGLRSLRGVMRHRAKVVIPRGAVTFIDDVFSGKEVDWGAVGGIMDRFGLSDIYYLHGVSLQRNGTAYAVVGPPGTGKSTLLDRMAGRGFQPVEDGWIILGKSEGNGGLQVITSGTYSLNSTQSRIHRTLRSCCCIKQAGSIASEDGLHAHQGLDLLLGRLAGIVGKLTARHVGGKSFTSEAIPLAGLINLSHPSDETPWRIRRDGAENIEYGELLKAVPETTKLVVISLPDKDAIRTSEETLKSWAQGR
jgi:hypothetical protein